MNGVLLKSPLQLEIKNNEIDRHLGRYKIVKTSKSDLNTMYIENTFAYSLRSIIRTFMASIVSIHGLYSLILTITYSH